MPSISRRWLDLLERTAATYVQAFAGLLLASSTGMVSLGSVRAAAIKSAFALGLGPTGTASLLPAPKPAATVAPKPPAA